MEDRTRLALLLASQINAPETIKNFKIVYTFLSGSRAYGINEPDSDYDLVAVFIPAPDYYLGLNMSKIPDAVEIKDIGVEMEDGSGIVVGIKYYELKHFVQLALKNNPNILEGLWADKDCIIRCNDTMSMLKDIRKLFLSTEKAYSAYRGYAYDQCTKMIGADAPTGRMGAKRKEILDKFGYDTKNATHLFRLLYTAIDVIRNQRIQVKLDEDARKFLMEIKGGKYALDELNDYIVKLMKTVDLAMEDAKKDGRILKAEPQIIDRVLFEALKKHFGWK